MGMKADATGNDDRGRVDTSTAELPAAGAT